jgi:hypothetical protein
MPIVAIAASMHSVNLNNIFAAAGRVVFKGFNPRFTHRNPDPLAEAAIHRIPQPPLQAPASLILQSQAPGGAIST